MLSFRSSFSDFTPENFPIGSVQTTPVIALYWDDHDVRNQGEIFYRTSEDMPLINEVGYKISEAFSTMFTPTTLFIATWDGVRQFLASDLIVRLTYIIIETNIVLLILYYVGQHLPSGDCH